VKVGDLVRYKKLYRLNTTTTRWHGLVIKTNGSCRVVLFPDPGTEPATIHKSLLEVISESW